MHHGALRRTDSGHEREPLRRDVALDREYGVGDRERLRAVRLLEELHPRLLGRARALLVIARPARGDDVRPLRLATELARYDVVVREVVHLERLATERALETVAHHDVDARELDALFVHPDRPEKARHRGHAHHEVA